MVTRMWMWFLLFLFSWEISALVLVIFLSILSQVSGGGPAMVFFNYIVLALMSTRMSLRIKTQPYLQVAVWKVRASDCYPPKTNGTK